MINIPDECGGGEFACSVCVLAIDIDITTTSISTLIALTTD